MSARDADLDAEQEVDLGRYWNAIVARWWLPLAGLLVGALIGYLVSLGGGQVWKASSTVYLGASYSVVGGILLQGPQANPSTVGTIARSEDSIERAAAKAGMRAGDLRGKVSRLDLLRLVVRAADRAASERQRAVAWPGRARDRGGQPDRLPGVAMRGGERPECERGAAGDRERQPALGEDVHHVSPCRSGRVSTPPAGSRFRFV